MYIFEDKLYATGRFELYNNNSTFYAGVWNDTTWNSLLSIDTVPMTGVAAAAMVNYKGNFYVAGDYCYYDHDSSVVCRLIMHDGTRWKAVKGNDSFSGYGSNYWVDNLLVWNDTLYIAGFFEEKQYNNPGNTVVKWDGTNFHRLSNGLTTYTYGQYSTNSYAYDIKVINNELYVCGMFNNVDGIGDKNANLDTSTNIAKWTGERWCTMGTNVNGSGSIYGIGNFRDSIYIFGVFNTINGQPVDYIAKWTGGSYTDTCAEPDLNSIKPIGDLQKSVSIYPNPNKGSFTLYCADTQPGSTNAELYVYDITGRLVHAEVIKNREQQIVLGNLGKGIYIARIVKQDNAVVVKIRIE